MKTILLFANFEAVLTWCWRALILMVVLLFIKLLFNYYQKKRAIRIEKEKCLAIQIEKNKKKHDELEKRKRRIDNISSSFSSTPLFDCDIVFIADIYNSKSGELDSFFSFTKVIDYSLINFVRVSGVKNQLVYDHAIARVLKMYNGLFKSTNSDYFLAQYLKSVNNLRDYTNKHRSRKGAFSLKQVIEKECSNFPPYAWAEDWNMDGPKSKN